MAGFLFSFAGPPVYGSPFYSDWLDLSALRSATAEKSLCIASPAGGNTGMATQLELSNDDPATLPAARTPIPFGEPVKGNNVVKVSTWSANYARVKVTGLPAVPTTSQFSLGVEFESSAPLTENGAFLNNALLRVAADTQLANTDQGAVADSSAATVQITLPTSADCVDGQTHTVMRDGAGHNVTVVPDGGTIQGGAGLTLSNDGDAVILSYEKGTNDWRIVALREKVGASDVVPSALNSGVLSPELAAGFTFTGAGTKSVAIPAGESYLFDGVMVVKNGAGAAGDTLVVNNDATAITNTMDLNVADKKVVVPTDIDPAQQVLTGPVNLNLVAVEGGGTVDCTVTVRLIRLS